MAMHEEMLGWWKLESWVQTYDDGRIVHPFGEDVRGRLVYGKDGDFVVMISRPDQPPFTTGGQWTADDQEKARSYSGTLAYFGRWECSEGRVSHHVETSLFPNWEGQTQVRSVALDGAQLTLGGRLEEGTPEARTANLVWKRASS
jgi:hypothetical protein